MSIKLLLAATALAVGTAPAMAQSTVADSQAANPPQELPYDRGYDKPSARTDAINAAEGPTTQALNNGSGSDAASQQTQAAVDQGQYAIDRKTYMNSLAEHDAAVDRTDQRWVHQQLAYADAMAAWRARVEACQRGHQRACDMASPTPDQFY